MLKKLIILNGPPDSGKDIAADYLVSKHGYTKLEMKGALRRLSHSIAALTGADDIFCDGLEYDRALKDTKRVPEFGNRTWPEFLIWLSEGVAKPIFGDDVFARAAIKAIRESNATHVVFSDGGFAVEVEALYKEFGSVDIIRMYRSGRGFSVGRKDSRRYINHPDPLKKPYHLVNDAGLVQLKLEADNFIKGVG